MNMIIDKRTAMHPDDIQKLVAAEARMDNEQWMDNDGNWRPTRNAVRAYRRRIRELSGLRYVTCHSVESGDFGGGVRMVAFGRVGQ